MRVVMLVNNPCVNDSRVIKSAEALAECGYGVIVVCRQHADLPFREERNGVEYHRVKPVPLDWSRLKSRIRTLFVNTDKMVEEGAASDPVGEVDQASLDYENVGNIDNVEDECEVTREVEEAADPLGTTGGETGSSPDHGKRDRHADGGYATAASLFAGSTMTVTERAPEPVSEAWHRDTKATIAPGERECSISYESYCVQSDSGDTGQQFHNEPYCPEPGRYGRGEESAASAVLTPQGSAEVDNVVDNPIESENENTEPEHQCSAHSEQFEPVKLSVGSCQETSSFSSRAESNRNARMKRPPGLLSRWLTSTAVKILSRAPSPVRAMVWPLLRGVIRLFRSVKRLARYIAGVQKRSVRRVFRVGKLAYSAVKRFEKRTVRSLKLAHKGASARIKRSSTRLGKRALTALYWFSEADEFGSAAKYHIAYLCPDVVHAHDLTTLPTGGRCASKVGAALVYDSHELEMHRNASYPRFVRLRRRRLERKYIRRADAIITVSESIADHLRADYRIARPTVVMNAPLFDDTIVPSSTVRQDAGLKSHEKLCVYVGSVTINRGLDLVVRALTAVPDLHFATVGPRRAATADELLSLATELGVRDRLHLIDPVAPSEVVGYIGTADVSVLPIQNVCLSYYYCMPNKLLESVFAGVPVAVADLLEMRRFVEANGCGVVMDETDPDGIARAIEHVSTERERYMLTPERRTRLADEYGWPTQAIHLQSIYSALGRSMARKSSRWAG